MLYQTRVDEIQDECGNVHTVYGIDAFQCVRSVPDVFTDEGKAEAFVKRCNELLLDLCHLDDVIEDLLAK